MNDWKPDRRSTNTYADFALETEGINIYSEGALHASLKKHIFREGDRLEVAIGGKVVDLVRANGDLVEIQTKRLDRIVDKVLGLAQFGHVHVVLPLAVETLIHRIDPATGELLATRKSPRHCDIYYIFDEMVRATSLIGAENVTIEACFVKIQEFRTRDGTGSWRRKGERTVARELLEVLETRRFDSKMEWLRILPESATAPDTVWDSASLASALAIAPARARKILYSLRKADILLDLGKLGTRKTFRVRPELYSPS
jgi:hypothetical protein